MVDQVNDAPRTRRALLAAAAAAGAATVASAVVKPLSVRAAVDDNADMFVGTVYGQVSLTTGLVNNSTGTTVFRATSGFGTAVEANSGSGSGGAAVLATSTGGSAGQAVRANGGTGRGVVGTSTSFYGVHAASTSGPALRAESGSGYGAHLTSDSNLALYAVSGTSSGAYIYSGATSVPAVQAIAGGGSAAIQAHAGSSVPSTVPNTAVQGTTEGSGTGGYFQSPAGNALRVVGKASFSRSGRSAIAAGKSFVDITVAGGLTSDSTIVATLQAQRGTACVTSVRVNYPSAGKARIYLNKVASASAGTPVAWFVIR